METVNLAEIEIKHIDYRKWVPIQGDLKSLSKKNYDKLKRSLVDKQAFIPAFIWEDEGEYKLLDGHQRHRLFTKESMQFKKPDGSLTYDYPCIMIKAKNLQDAKERLLVISSQYGKIEQEGFDEFIFDLDDEYLDNLIHFDGMQGINLMDEGQEDDYKIPDNIETDIVPGDLIEIGEHRLLCGDSTNADDVEKLLQGKEPYLMITDPPYGINYKPEWRSEAMPEKNDKDHGRSIGKVNNDDNADWRESWALSPAKVAYVYHAGKYTSIVQESLEVCDYEIRSQIIWAKSHFAISRGDYHGQHEPIWYAVKKGSKGNWAGDRKQTTIWEIEKNQKNETGHSTQKPVECMARPMGNHDGDVYDPFIGSGTAMVAAHQLSRKCYGMEIDPKYCQVIIDRMLKLDDSIVVKVNGKDYGTE